MPITVILTLTLTLLLPTLALAQPACTHYASPQGQGASCSATAPCKVQSWWPLAGPGKVLCLKSGTYAGSSSMIAPPPGVRGTAAAPITIRAEHDGGPTLDAQHGGFAVRLAWHSGPATENTWFVVEGIDAKNGLESVYSVSGSDNVLRRVIGYNGTSGANPYVFNIAGYRSRAEDCAGWGHNVRKIFNGSQAGDLQGAGFRRCWGEWNDHAQGSSSPNNTYELGYGSTNQLYENVIGTWDRRGEVGETEGVMHMFSGQPEVPNAIGGSKVLGSIFYVRPGATFHADAVVAAHSISGMTMQDVASIVPDGYMYAPFWFSAYGCGEPCSGNVCRNCLSVHAGKALSNEQGSGWTTPGLHQGRGLAAATGGESAFTLLPGICRRYEGGVLTDKPLFPWPMNDRIKKARVESGFPAVDVTAEVEALLGTIPAACRSGGPVEPPIEPPPVEPPITVSGTPLSCVGVQSAQGGVAIACVPQGQEGRK